MDHPARLGATFRLDASFLASQDHAASLVVSGGVAAIALSSLGGRGAALDATYGCRPGQGSKAYPGFTFVPKDAVAAPDFTFGLKLSELGAFVFALEFDNGADRVTPTQVSAAEQSLTYSPAFASAQWDIVHNFGRVPNTVLVDSTGQEVGADIFIIDPRTSIRVVFSSATGGTAYLS